MSVAEALSAGVPVVVTDHGAWAQVATIGAGFVVDHNGAAILRPSTGCSPIRDLRARWESAAARGPHGRSAGTPRDARCCASTKRLSDASRSPHRDDHHARRAAHAEPAWRRRRVLLSRQISSHTPGPAITVSLHDRHVNDPALRAAGGSRSRFIADALTLAPHCGRETIIVCSRVTSRRWRGCSRGAAPSSPTCSAASRRGCRCVRRSSGRCRPGAWSRSPRTQRAASCTRTRRSHRRRLISPSWTSSRAEVPAADPVEPAALIVARMAASEGYKGHEQLLRIWPRVLARHPRAQLWIVGDGDDRPRLEAVAAHVGVSAAVTFAGRVTDEELNHRYRGARFS